MTINRKPGQLNRTDLLKSLKWREWIGKYLPEGDGGFTNNDIDMVINIFSDLVNRSYNESGKISFIEVKEGYGEITPSQKKTFGLINALMRRGDPDKKFYRGFYIMKWTDDSSVKIGDRILSKIGGSESELARWLRGEFEIPSQFKSKWD